MSFAIKSEPINLDSVAMVNVPINDQDPLDVVSVDGILGSDGHVVEEAEPVGLVLLSVVARRSDDGQTLLRLVLKESSQKLSAIAIQDLHHGGSRLQ